jgi:integrase
MAKQLTAAAVLRLRPGSQRREIPDGGCGGLGLIIQPSGHKSWALRFRRPSGQSAKLTLGPLDLTGGCEPEAEPVIGQPLTLASARRLATGLHRERALGKDLIALAHRERLERRVRGASGFGLASRDFIEGYAKKRQRRWQQTARLLGWRQTADGLELISKGLADRWHDRPLREVTGDDLHFLIEEAREHGIPGLEARNAGGSEARARMLHAVLGTLFTWLVAKRRLPANPCVGLSRPTIPASRDRVLSDEEIVKFWSATETPTSFHRILRLLLLTGCRLREVSDLRWSELSADRATIELPPNRTKNKRRHTVELPALAHAILAGTPANGGELVFGQDGDRPLAGFSHWKRQLDGVLGIPSWKIHDLRRTTATVMATIGVAPHIVEAVLNHASGFRSGPAGVYNRAPYAAERKAALERLAHHIEALVAGEASKIIQWPGRA